MLEAIAYLSTQRSFRGSPRESLLREGSTAAFVRAEVAEGAHRTLLEIEIRPGVRDRVTRNRQRVTRLQELIDTLRVTMFSPDDLVLIKGGPEERRRYLDDLLESRHARLGTLRQMFERVLRQRNMLLRQVGGRLDGEARATLDVWDAQLAVHGSELAAARTALVDELARPAADAFRRLTGLPGTLQVAYLPSYNTPLAELLEHTRADDLRRGVTTKGPHRDDLGVSLDGLDARTRLSQGRQRAATLALRLAAHDVLTVATGTAPLLLLDDVFSELDPPTAEALAGELPTGQAILTTAGALPDAVAPGTVQRLIAGAFRP